MAFGVDEYVADVLAGRILACRWVRLACERHRRDLEGGEARGIWFDERRAAIVLAFFGLLHHWKGEWAGQPIELSPWEAFVVASLFGWMKRDEEGNAVRRFRTGYLEVARKNGKTTLAAGIGLALMLIDGEPGAEIYTAATKREQARIAHRDATEMAQRSPHIRELVGIVKDNIHNLESGSKFEPLGRDANTTDGLNVHGVIADELHAWKNRDMWDKLETATGSRRQPLMLAITTAGYDRQSLCWQLHDYTEKVLGGLVADDSFFGTIYTLDEGDDWRDEDLWIKANPNLGVSKKLEDMRRLAKRAREMPSGLNAFLRLHLNLWTQAEERWIAPEVWAKCGERPLPDLAGRRCYGGLDLSSTQDVTAWVLVFPPVYEGEPFWVLCRLFLPEENLTERVRNDRAPYDVWARDGLLELTPGNRVDYEWVVQRIAEDYQAYDIREVAFDRWGAARMITMLHEIGGEDWLVEFGQGYASMSSPMKELERLLLGGEIGHGGNRALAWMADNVVASIDPAGNIKPDKSKSQEKIDGIVALIMALDRAVRNRQAESIYQKRGIRLL